eukprot:scaffold23151_cov117-Isochrysis_galbana.AAC.2
MGLWQQLLRTALLMPRAKAASIEASRCDRRGMAVRTTPSGASCHNTRKLNLNQYVRAFGMDDPPAETAIWSAHTSVASSSNRAHGAASRSVLFAPSHSVGAAPSKRKVGLRMMLHPVRLAWKHLVPRGKRPTAGAYASGHRRGPPQYDEMSEDDLLALLDGGAESLGMIAALRR